MRKFLRVTDIRNFAKPARPDAAILVAARHDSYVPAYSPRLMHKHWPGSELRWLDTGHIGACLFYQRAFLQAIIDAFGRL